MSNDKPGVYLAQLLCPARHCICACAGEYESLKDAQQHLIPEVLKRFADVVEQGVANPWCAICESKMRDFHLETARTRWDTMEEAKSFLQLEEALQGMTQVVIKSQKQKAKSN